MVVPKISPQSAFFDDQDTVPDINTVYSNFIKEIDANRSRFNAIDTNLSQSISKEKIDNIFVNTDINTPQYQESRLHTFYRMIGFPVVSSSGFYSPGYDPSLNTDDEKLGVNINIANSISKELKQFLTLRELYAKNIYSKFSKKDLNSIALSMSSIYIRPISKQLDKNITDPLGIDKQSFKVPERSGILDFFSNNSSLNKEIIITSIHMLKPFIVDPRIELTTIPARNKICAPFLANKTQTILVNGVKNTQLKRPYIEKVISTRFSSKSVNEDNGKYISSIIDFMKSDNGIADNDLTTISTNLFSLQRSELVIFYKYIRLIRSIIDLLAKSILLINKTREKINWQPIPDTNGPEYGSSVKEVDLNDNTNNKEIENNILKLKLLKDLRETEFDIGLSGENSGNFSFSGIDDIVFGSFKNIGKVYDDQIDQLKNSRESYAKKANDALRNIEIIMGEFSGIGLLDILAIQASLWIMEPQYLIGLIDKNAVKRMIDNKKTNNTTIDNNYNIKPIIESLQEFEKRFIEIFELIQLFLNNRMGELNKNQ